MHVTHKSIVHLLVIFAILVLAVSCGDTWRHDSIEYVSDWMRDSEEIIELPHVDLYQKDIDRLSSLRSLQRLSIGELPEGAYFTGIDSTAPLGKIKSLQELSLVVHNLKESDLEFIFSLESLRFLKIRTPYGSQLNLSTDFAKKLLQLKELRELGIDDSGVTDEFRAILEQGRQWEALKLTGATEDFFLGSEKYW